MPKKINPNIELLELAVLKLGDLISNMVFVGGCTTGLMITDLAAPAVRVTEDVDIITDVDLHGYYSLGEKLKIKGFSEDMSEYAPICRWKQGDLKIDVMPTDPKTLGFTNYWFKSAFKASQMITLPSVPKCQLLLDLIFWHVNLLLF